MNLIFNKQRCPSSELQKCWHLKQREYPCLFKGYVPNSECEMYSKVKGQSFNGTSDG